MPGFNYTLLSFGCVVICHVFTYGWFDVSKTFSVAIDVLDDQVINSSHVCVCALCSVHGILTLTLLNNTFLARGTICIANIVIPSVTLCASFSSF